MRAHDSSRQQKYYSYSMDGSNLENVSYEFLTTILRKCVVIFAFGLNASRV